MDLYHLQDCSENLQAYHIPSTFLQGEHTKELGEGVGGLVRVRCGMTCEGEGVGRTCEGEGVGGLVRVKVWEDL